MGQRPQTTSSCSISGVEDEHENPADSKPAYLPFNGTQPLPGTYSRAPEGLSQPVKAKRIAAKARSTMYFAIIQ